MDGKGAGNPNSGSSRDQRGHGSYSGTVVRKVPVRGGERTEESPQKRRRAERRTDQTSVAESGTHGPGDRHHARGDEGLSPFRREDVERVKEAIPEASERDIPLVHRSGQGLARTSPLVSPGACD